MSKKRKDLPEVTRIEFDRHHLAMLDDVRYADSSVRKALLFSHYLILTRSATEALGTRMIQQLMTLPTSIFLWYGQPLTPPLPGNWRYSLVTGSLTHLHIGLGGCAMAIGSGPCFRAK